MSPSGCHHRPGSARSASDGLGQLMTYPTTIIATTATTSQKISHLLPRQSSHHSFPGAWPECGPRNYRDLRGSLPATLPGADSMKSS